TGTTTPTTPGLISSQPAPLGSCSTVRTGCSVTRTSGAAPRAREHRPGLGPQLAARDHVLEPRCKVRVIGVEHIEYVMQLPPPSVDLVDHIAQSERAHKNGNEIRPPLRHLSLRSVATPRSRAPRDAG